MSQCCAPTTAYSASPFGCSGWTLPEGNDTNQFDDAYDTFSDSAVATLPNTRVIISGEELTPRWAAAPEGSWRVLVPAVTASAEAELRFDLDGVPVTIPFTLVPQRRWSVHLIHHSHYDIGYTDPQHIVRANHLEYLDSVLAQMRATDDLPDEAKFRWNE